MCCRSGRERRILLLFVLLFVVRRTSAQVGTKQKGGRLKQLSETRAVFQTDHGDIHLAFYPNAAPKTVELLTKLIEIGAYNTNHFFRVDKGFVAQVADVASGRTQDLNDFQQKYASKTVPLEVHESVKHDAVGILSLARHDDPNSGGSSFSILLGPAPHLDMQYTIFGEIVSGFDVLESIQQVETFKEGIFVMPKKRITIHSTYLYTSEGNGIGSYKDQGTCENRLNLLVKTLKSIKRELQGSSSPSSSSSLSSEVSSF